NRSLKIDFNAENYEKKLNRYFAHPMTETEKYILIESAADSLKIKDDYQIAENFLQLIVSYAKKSSSAASYWIVSQALRDNQFRPEFSMDVHLFFVINALAFPVITFDPPRPYAYFSNLIHFFNDKKMMNQNYIDKLCKTLQTSPMKLKIEFSY